ncbi:MAG: energy-coupling factor transporter transmembrane protein EcfT [Nitrospirales bacterium]|nr:energy-coupling factor transporter transmembrane protein EcfT [Nitrospira sp.]MDR4501542.1 energy-coupling factor transporter transmembrane protein EcfT [Nitrospirales bacterium]
MTISLYLDRDTWIHRLDARTKILGVLALFSLALLYTHPMYLLGVWSLVLFFTASAQAWANIRKFLILLVLLFLYSLVLWPFFIEGQTPLFHWWVFTVSVEGMMLGLSMAMRLTVMVVSGVLLLSTTRLEDFAFGLQRFGVPSPMCFALSLAFRWVPALLGASRLIVQAQRSRGLDLSAGTLGEKIRGYVPLVVPLIGHTLRQTTLLTMALEVKGFRPGRQPHPYNLSTFKFFDYVVLITITCLVGVSWLLRMKGYGV